MGLFGDGLDLDRECSHQFAEGTSSRTARVPADDYANFDKIGCREAANPGCGYLRQEGAGFRFSKQDGNNRR